MAYDQMLARRQQGRRGADHGCRQRAGRRRPPRSSGRPRHSALGEIAFEGSDSLDDPNAVFQ
ncbi:MAG: hypothetical protein MZV49_19610 [Rhodopseudomonas palustris]|nr:hypothetical protein [Rhodopseudomonas palustris]